MSSFAKGALSHLSDFGGIDGGICKAIQKVNKVNQHVIRSLYFPPPLPFSTSICVRAGPLASANDTESGRNPRIMVALPALMCLYASALSREQTAWTLESRQLPESSGP